MKSTVLFHIFLLPVIASTTNSSTSTSQWVLKQRASVESQVNELVKKSVTNLKLPLDFAKMNCVESGDEIQQKESPLIRLGVCIIKGDSKTVPVVTGSFAVLVSSRGVKVEPILIEAE
jgi:hypothetical protein